MKHDTWWILVEGQVSGPRTSLELRQLVKESKLFPTSLVSPDQKQWLVAAKIFGLFPAHLADDSPEVLVPDPRKPLDVFISYSSKDKEWADAACAVLEGHRIRCWIAPRDILPGLEWGEAIIRGIDTSSVMLLIFSSSANDSRQVRRETERALSKGLSILPFRIEDVRPVGAMEYALSNTHWLDGFTPPVEKHLEKLAQSIQSLLDFVKKPVPVEIKQVVHEQSLSSSLLKREGPNEKRDVVIEAMPRTEAESLPVQSAEPISVPFTDKEQGGSALALLICVLLILVIIAIGFLLPTLKRPTRSEKDSIATNREATGKFSNLAPDSNNPQSSEKDSITTGQATNGKALNSAPDFNKPITSPISRRETLGITPDVELSHYTSKTTGMKFVRIKAGKFVMGSTTEQIGTANAELKKLNFSFTFDYEGPQHEVILTKDYFLGVYEVTRGEFRKFVTDTDYKTEAEADGDGGIGWDVDAKTWKQEQKYNWRNPGFAQSDSHPVVNVSWNDAVKFSEWLSRKDGRSYRLPTEAEWEFACRADSRGKYHFSDNDEALARFANVADLDFRNVTGKSWGIQDTDGYAFTSPVGSFRSNSFGLHDMHGNVAEWCSDRYGAYGSGEYVNPLGTSEGSNRVYRGGSWFNSAVYCRSAYRSRLMPACRDSNLGFRLTLVPSGL